MTGEPLRSVGSAHGIQLSVDNTTIRGLSAYGEPIPDIAFAEAFSGVAPGPFEADSVANRFDLVRSVRLTQSLAQASRMVTVEPTLERAAPYLATTLMVKYKVTDTIRWQIDFGAAEAREVEGGLLVEGASGLSCTVRCASVSPNVSRDTGDTPLIVAFEIPEGTHQFHLDLSYSGTFNVADVAILVRPEQLRELAIVRSSLAGQSHVPVFVCDRMPLDRGDYVDKQKRLRRLARDSLAAATLREMGTGGMDLDASAARSDAMHELQSELAEYRSLVSKYNRILRVLLRFRCKTLIILFDGSTPVWVPDSEPKGDGVPENDLAQVFSDQRPSSSIVRILLAGTDTPAAKGEVHYYDDLASLSRVASDRFRGSQVSAEDSVFVPTEQTEAYFAATFDALSTGRMLVPRGDRAEEPPRALIRASTASDHVVLVEADSLAERLIGVEYAVNVGADLVVLPPASTGEIDSALEEIDRHVSKEKPYEQYVDKISEYLTTFVDGAVVDFVGAKRLTAFSKVRPYHFVRGPKANWREKPLGIVPFDADLLVVADVLHQSPFGRRVVFSIMVDSGYFVGSETPKLHRDTGAHYTRAFVLDPARYMGVGMMDIAAIPSKFILFNTHGDDGGIMLGHLRVPSYQISNWVEFHDGPTILNNSCLSWTGVGREFIRAGAGRYIGSLWSIYSDDAARFAEDVSERVFEDGQSYASAVASSRSSETSMSYVYLGLIDAGLQQHGFRKGDDLRGFRAIAQQLTHYTRELEPLARWAANELEQISNRADEHVDSGSPEDRVEALSIKYLALMCEVDTLNSADVLLRCRGMLDALEVAPSDVAHLAKLLGIMKVETLLTEANCLFDAGRRDEAKRSYVRALELANGETQGDINTKLRYASFLMKTSDLDGARALLKGIDISDELSANTSFERTRIGVLTQLARHAGDIDLAERLAQQGLEAARQAGDRVSENAFLGDFSNIRQAQSRFEDALKLSTDAARLALERSDIDGYLAYRGQIAQCLVGLERRQEAIAALDETITVAQEREANMRLGILLHDRSMLRLEQEAVDADAVSADTAWSLILTSQAGLFSGYMPRLHTTFNRVLTSDAAIRRFLSGAILSSSYLPEPVFNEATKFWVHNLLVAMTKMGTSPIYRMVRHLLTSIDAGEIEDLVEVAVDLPRGPGTPITSMYLAVFLKGCESGLESAESVADQIRAELWPMLTGHQQH